VYIREAWRWGGRGLCSGEKKLEDRKMLDAKLQSPAFSALHSLVLVQDAVLGGLLRIKTNADCTTDAAIAP